MDEGKMIFQNQITEHEMVATFLRAEMNSPRYKHYIASQMKQFALSNNLIEYPNFESNLENYARAHLLEYRGYFSGTALFENFPRDVFWQRATLEPQDILCYGNHEEWVALSEGNRMVAQGAANLLHRLQFKHAKEIIGLTHELAWDKKIPELVVVQQDFTGTLVLLEGHARATTYMMLEKQDIKILLGRSNKIKNWRYY